MIAKKKDSFEIMGPGYLSVTIHEAKNLLALDNGKSDPFCKITGSFTSQIFQTKTKKKTVSPIWEESFAVYVGDLEESFTLTVKVYDRDFVGQDFLGETLVPLGKILVSENGYTSSNWFTLNPETQKKKGLVVVSQPKPINYGSIKIGLKYIPLGHSRGIILKSDPDKEYKFDKVLGKGSFGVVRRAVHRGTGNCYAAKIIEKRSIEGGHKRLLEREIHVMSRLHHSNIVSLEACYDTPKLVVLIMELVSGGELFQDIISRNEGYSERDAMQYTRQICSALAYLHSLGIAHRDLKPVSKSIDLPLFTFLGEPTSQ
eukprot:TRINITY_DN12382_c0_g1_i1.p1 TRINITY_DN12382_c0_g1~~TRINITY_DN12382_c0_g1_i1.p1  ORF type:complete len:315 (-),score=56.66 TRINITY_DN12382_c0_g1_i1:4-948(-)